LDGEGEDALSTSPNGATMMWLIRSLYKGGTYGAALTEDALGEKILRAALASPADALEAIDCLREFSVLLAEVKANKVSTDIILSSLLKRAILSFDIPGLQYLQAKARSDGSPLHDIMNDAMQTLSLSKDKSPPISAHFVDASKHGQVGAKLTYDERMAKQNAEVRAKFSLKPTDCVKCGGPQHKEDGKPTNVCPVLKDGRKCGHCDKPTHTEKVCLGYFKSNFTM
jgi:hypothetical protein